MFQYKKKCKICQEPKLADDFTKSKATCDGLGSYCKACARDYENNRRFFGAKELREQKRLQKEEKLQQEKEVELQRLEAILKAERKQLQRLDKLRIVCDTCQDKKLPDEFSKSSKYGLLMTTCKTCVRNKKQIKKQEKQQRLAIINDSLKNGKKICTKCNKPKHFKFFSKNNTSVGYNPQCRACENKANREQRKAEILTPEQKEHRRLRDKANALQYKYGMSLEDYDKLYNEQKGKCYLCDKPKSNQGSQGLIVHYNHQDKKALGLCCMRCKNILHSGIGFGTKENKDKKREELLAKTIPIKPQPPKERLIRECRDVVEVYPGEEPPKNLLDKVVDWLTSK